MNKKYKLKIPKLKLRYRILLYFSMIVFAALSLINVAFECFSDVVGILIYILAACTLFTGMYYLVMDFKLGLKETVENAKVVVASNPYASKVASDYRLRTVVFMVPGVLGNVVFALFNGIIGILSHSAWFGSLAAYYILLSVMRIGAVQQERIISKMDEKAKRFEKEISVYRKNSILFILLAIVLVGMIILLETSQGGKTYPGFTIYAAAAYAFYKIIMSSVNMIKVGKQHSPLLMTIRRIGYIDACVSILTLQTAMFVSFADGQEMFTKIMNGVTGGSVCVIVLSVGIQGIISAGKMKRKNQLLDIADK